MKLKSIKQGTSVVSSFSSGRFRYFIMPLRFIFSRFRCTVMGHSLQKVVHSIRSVGWKATFIRVKAVVHRRFLAPASDIPLEVPEIRYEPRTSTPAEPCDIKLIAFYLPQFHTFPENDEWWGKGFTEWTNVRRAKPMFPGHVQPEEPHEDIGWYTLDNPEVLRKQAELARHYGIYGFCFHHYWFSGKRLMEKPVDMFLSDPSIELPFCLNWANENWTRRWDGQEQEVLIAQQHSPEDNKAFMLDMLRYFKDPRYIRIDGRPILLIYRVDMIPDIRRTIKIWNDVCTGNNENTPYLVMCQTFGNYDPANYEFDAGVQFTPHTPWHMINNHFSFGKINLKNKKHNGNIYNYVDLATSSINGLSEKFINFPCIVPSWDNTPRRMGSSTIFAFSTPSLYENWLYDACTFISKSVRDTHKMVFINAWNEWAEGAHLEPSKNFGYAYLNATQRALSRYSSLKNGIIDNGISWYINENFSINHDLNLDCSIAVHLHLYYTDLKNEIIIFLNRMPVIFDLYISILQK